MEFTFDFYRILKRNRRLKNEIFTKIKIRHQKLLSPILYIFPILLRFLLIGESWKTRSKFLPKFSFSGHKPDHFLENSPRYADVFRLQNSMFRSSFSEIGRGHAPEFSKGSFKFEYFGHKQYFMNFAVSDFWKTHPGGRDQASYQ